MNKKYFCFGLFVFLCSFSLFATVPNNNELSIKANQDTLSGILKDYFILKFVPVKDNQLKVDTVSKLYEQYFGELDYLNDPSTPERYIALDPDYYRLFVPFTYYKSAIGSVSTIKSSSDLLRKEKDIAKKTFPIDDYIFLKKNYVNQSIDAALLSAYVSHPDKIINFEEVISGLPAYEENNILKEVKKKERTSVLKQFGKNEVKDVEGEAGVDIKKPNWWVQAGNIALQFSQNYISDNWYKGGESTNAVNGSITLSATYNDKEKVQWENILDAKFGIASAPSDTLHSYLVTTDQLRLTSKLGIQAAKYWYYTVSTEFKTQFAHGYKSNSNKKLTSWLSPSDFNLGIGIDFKKKSKIFDLSVFIAPLTYTVKYIGADDIDHSLYGLEQDQKFRHNFGSEIVPKLKWNISKDISYETRLDALTSYSWVRVDWEHTLNLAINKYLSTRLYVHARFDDSNKPTTGDSYFQLNELLSFGLNYKW